MEIFEYLSRLKLIPVVVLERVDLCERLGAILMQDNLPCAEITFRTEQTADILHRLSTKFPKMLLAAGTVLTASNAQKAIDNGASFVVCPGFDPKLVEFCLKKNIPIIPGVATASEIQVAMSMGLTVLKFFPAADLGGAKMIKALSAPFKTAHFVPTGGITKDNIAEFLKVPSVLACGGTWMVKKDLIEACRFEEIDSLVAEAVKIVRQVSAL